MGFEVGQSVANYDILESFDGSRIGESYRVRNTLGDRIEQLRILSREEEPESVERFLREIKVHAKLTHPNIVTFYNAVEIGGQLVMTTEYVEGATLEERIEQGPIEPGEAVRWTLQVLDALQFAHEHGIVHREVSPANIRITKDGTVKLSGFGLAKGVGDPQLTQVGTVMGWIEYMAPEQIQCSAVSPRTDIYAVGAVLYEMVTGQVPFICESQFDLMLAHVQRQPTPPLEIKPQISPDLSSAILTALEKDPEKRFASAQAFRTALETVLVELERSPRAAAAPDQTAPVKPSPAPQPVAAPLPEPLVRPSVRAVPTPQRVESSWTTARLVLLAFATFVVALLGFYWFLTLTRG